MKTPLVEKLNYRVCPRCARAMPASSEERFCINDGTWMLEGCPLCGAAITSPYARFCGVCGQELQLQATLKKPP